MNKMLVIKDLPEHLEGKKLFVEFTIYGAEEEGVVPAEVGIHGRQRLIDIPQKKTIDIAKWNDYGSGWDIGYNACVDEILGGEE